MRCGLLLVYKYPQFAASPLVTDSISQIHVQATPCTAGDETPHEATAQIDRHTGVRKKVPRGPPVTSRVRLVAGRSGGFQYHMNSPAATVVVVCAPVGWRRISEELSDGREGWLGRGGELADYGNAAVSEGLKQHCCCCVLVHNTPAGDVVFSQPCPIARGRSHRRIALQVQCKAQGFAHSLGCKRPEPSLLVRRRHKSSGVFCLWEWRLEGRRLWRLDSRRRGSGGGLGE